LRPFCFNPFFRRHRKSGSLLLYIVDPLQEFGNKMGTSNRLCTACIGNCNGTPRTTG
jgi:hypothetical protein